MLLFLYKVVFPATENNPYFVGHCAITFSVKLLELISVVKGEVNLKLQQQHYHCVITKLAKAER